MNKNDKVHSGITPELNENALDTVSGGTTTDKNNHYYFGLPPSEPYEMPAILHPFSKMVEDTNADTAGHV